MINESQAPSRALTDGIGKSSREGNANLTLNQYWRMKFVFRPEKSPVSKEKNLDLQLSSYSL